MSSGLDLILDNVDLVSPKYSLMSFPPTSHSSGFLSTHISGTTGKPRMSESVRGIPHWATDVNFSQ